VNFDTVIDSASTFIASSDYNNGQPTASNSQRKLVGTNLGIMYAVYPGLLAGIYQVFVKESADYGLTWTNETRISTYTGMEAGTQAFPSIAVDSQDRLHVVWRGVATGFPIEQIWYARYDGSWTDPVRISTLGMEDGSQGIPSIAMDSQDRPHVTWSGDNTDFPVYNQAWYARHYYGSWTDPVRISTNTAMDNGYQGSPSITVFQNKVHIVWSSGTTIYTTSQIYYALYDGSWADPVRISTYTNAELGTQATPSIAIDSQGRPHVVWHGRPSASGSYPYDIYYALYDGAWINTKIADILSRFLYNPSIDIDSEDRPHVVFAYNDDRIMYMKYTTSWSSPIYLQPTASSYANLMITRFPPWPLRNPNLPAKFHVGQDSTTLFAEFTVNKFNANANLLAEFTVRHWAGQAIKDLFAYFDVN